jgi:superfamily I DNA/RNA helicase
MESRLTPQQQEAFRHDGHLLIVAGPGSGKTSTCVAKAARILQDPQRSLAMVSFTREAAEEMRQRLLRSMPRPQARPPGEERLVVATFHGIAIRHLKRHGLAQRLLSPAAQASLYLDAVVAAGVDRSERAEVQKEFEKVMYSVDQQVDVMPVTAKVLARYAQLLKACARMDLYSVMRQCALRVHAGSIPPLPFSDMLVDEGQDTDELQRLWIFAHARAGCRVTIVGDDDQSIYEWRNALGYQGMRSFLETFRAHRIELGDNFRCRPEISDAAALLIAHNEPRLGKRMVARRDRGGAIGAFRAASNFDQNARLADLIEQLPGAHTEVAVLARTNRSLDLLEVVLRGRGIRYTRLGKSIWEQPVIAGYVGLLQMLLDGNPSGLLSALQMCKVSPEIRCELLVALSGDASSLLEGTVPKLARADSSDKGALRELAAAFAYWRRQLRCGAVREVVLEVGEQYAHWATHQAARDLVHLCSRILADMRGALSARLLLVGRDGLHSGTAPIVLTTMHGAKGLEFRTVHIIDAGRDQNGSEIVRPQAERRLMYVALTRAKDCCVIWHSGEPHPTLAEGQVVYQKTWGELVSLVEGAT